MRRTAFLAVILMASAPASARDYIYTFWTPGMVHVYMLDPDNMRDPVGLTIYDVTGATEFVSGFTDNELPYGRALPEGSYRLEADDAVAVMVGEPSIPACPNFFIQPHIGDGVGSLLYTGDADCGDRGRTFLLSPHLGAEFTIAPSSLLDPGNVRLDADEYWREIDSVFHSICYFDTDARTATVQVHSGRGHSGYFVPALNDHEYMFFVSGHENPDPFPDSIASVRISTGDVGSDVVVSRFIDERRKVEYVTESMPPGDDLVMNFVEERVLHVDATNPVVVSVMPALDNSVMPFCQFAHPLDAPEQESPAYGTSFRVPMRPDGYMRLFGGSGTTRVELYDEDLEYVDAVSFNHSTTLEESTYDSGWYTLRSSGERFAVQVGRERPGVRGATYVPRNPVADIIDRPLAIHNLEHYPAVPVPTYDDVQIFCLTNAPAYVDYYWSEVGDPSWSHSSEGWPPESVHSVLLPMVGFIPGATYNYYVEARDPTTGQTATSETRFFTVEDGSPDVVHVETTLTHNRDTNVVTAETTLRNDGSDTAYGVGLSYDLRGLFPLGDPGDTPRDSLVSPGANAIFDYHATTAEDLLIGESLTVTTTLRPYIWDGHYGGWKLHAKEIDFRDRNAEEFTTTADVWKSMNYAHVRDDFLRETDYVLLTCPRKLYDLFPSETDVANLLVYANYLARQRDGVLLFANGDFSRDTVRGQVHGRFNGLLSESWKDGGYLTILGELEIIGAYYWEACCHYWSGGRGRWRARHVDQYWADTHGDDYHRPELALGRIIGNDTATMIQTMSNALRPSYLEKAFVMSGDGNRAEEDIKPAARDFTGRCESDYILFDELHMVDGASVQDILDFLRAEAPESDMIGGFFHGNVDLWSAVTVDDIVSPTAPIAPLTFGTKNPMVVSMACLTGRYYEADQSLAEAFLSLGAAGFIGATESTPLYKGEDFAWSVGKYISDTDMTFGRGFKTAKRHFANNNHAYAEGTIYMALVNNFYGDPARPIFDEDGSGSGAQEGAGAAEGEPLHPGGRLTVDIPKLVFRDYGDYDRVFWEDQGTLTEEDRPVVPFHTERVLLDNGLRVEDVRLERKSNREEGRRLRLPAPTFYYLWEDPPKPVFSEYERFWPEAEYPEFTWSVTPSPLKGGVQADELLITMYPFNYNPSTTDWYCDHSYSFQVSTVESSVSISEIIVEPEPSSLTDTKLTVGVAVQNAGQGFRARWDLRLLDYEDKELSDAQGSLTITDGASVHDFELPIARLVAGQYRLQVTLLDSGGGLLHRDGLMHVHGRSEMLVEEIAVRRDDPCSPQAGSITFDSQVRNIGETKESGRVCIAVYHDDGGERLAFFSQEFEDVGPTQRVDFEAEWDPGSLAEGSYRASFWVESTGGTSAIKSEDFESCREMELFVVPDADSYTQMQTAVVLMRAVHDDETVAGVTYTAWVERPGPFPVKQRAVEEHPRDGGYFLYNFSPGLGEGIYTITARAEAPGYRTVETVAKMVLSRNPAVFWPADVHYPADGDSTVTLRLGPVYRDHGWNPDINRHWDGRARHGVDPIFGFPWDHDAPPGWASADASGLVLTPVPNGSLATVSTTAGVIATADAAPGIPGHQVELNGGNASIALRAPASERIAYVLVETESAASLAFTYVIFTTEDPNENSQRWCVGDLRQVIDAQGIRSHYPRYRRELELNADGNIKRSDYISARSRWTGPPPVMANSAGSSDPLLLLKGDWEQAALGETFTMRVDLRAGRAVSGIEAVFEYDPSILSLGEISLGEWFTLGSDTRLLGPDQGIGRVTLGGLREAPGDVGVLGEGTVFTIRATVVGEGSMGLDLPAAVAAAPDGSNLPVRRFAEDHQTTGTPTTLRGDANGDGERNITDAIYFLGCLFLGGGCPESDCQADSNNDGGWDVSDAVFLLNFLFLGGPDPAPCL